MLSRHAIIWAGLLAAGAAECSSEREFSGIWQQVCDEEHPCVAGGLRFELHLGRYGDALTGLLVRYRDPGPELDAYRKSNDCGCFFVDSGRAGDETVSFRVDALGEAGYPDTEGTRAQSCDPAPVECPGGTFVLRGDGDLLTGTLTCDGVDVPVQFVSATGRPRTVCLPPEALE